MEFQLNQAIHAGNYIVHIGTMKVSDVAVYSKFTGKVVSFDNIMQRGKLHRVKRAFKNRIASSEAFYFSFMSTADTVKLIEMLKN